MTGELIPILAVLVLLVVVLVAFVKELAPPEVIAMSAFCLLVVLGILPVDRAYEVFSNTAPITIASMFILSACMEKSGLIDALGHVLDPWLGRQIWITLPVLIGVVAGCSAFVNNTPIVAVFLPVILAISRRQQTDASKLLIPLSYAAVLGGCCTLIGTSTNILVSGIAVGYGKEPLGMFEFTPLGIVFLGIGTVYISIFGPKWLPSRAGVTTLLEAKDRQQFLCHVLITPRSSLVGQRLTDTVLANEGQGFRIVEVRRGGARSVLPLNEIRVMAYDRVLLAVSSTNMEANEHSDQKTLKEELRRQLGIENLSTIKGAVIEGIVSPHSRLIGQSLKSIRFRQTYGMLAMAVHRKGTNLAHHFQTADLRFGDTILMLGPQSTFARLRNEGDFMLLEDMQPARPADWKMAILSILALAGVVLVASLGAVPIVFAATVACVVMMWLKYIQPQEAYKAVDWSIIFLLYGMLAMGAAMESTGAARWVAGGVVNLVESVVPAAWLPIVALSLIYLLGSVLTEVLSNNATAVVMAPIAINTAISLNLDPRPFIIAVAFSSSAAFSTPLGYQTHMMVYGAGGYRFTDFLRFGAPLNLILWLVATWLIPIIWPF